MKDWSLMKSRVLGYTRIIDNFLLSVWILYGIGWGWSLYTLDTQEPLGFGIANDKEDAAEQALWFVTTIK